MTIAVILCGLAVRHDFLSDASGETLHCFDLVFGRIAYVTGLAVATITVISGLVYFLENRQIIRYS